jgi:hypothetical protein
MRGKNVGIKYSIRNPIHKNVGIKYQLIILHVTAQSKKEKHYVTTNGDSCTKEEGKKNQLDKHPRIIRCTLFQEIMKKKLFCWVVP